MYTKKLIEKSINGFINTLIKFYKEHRFEHYFRKMLKNKLLRLNFLIFLCFSQATNYLCVIYLFLFLSIHKAFCRVKVYLNV